MSARDELAKLLGDHYGTSAGKDDYLWSMADIIIERGYRKPRTIETAEELDALGNGAAILDATGAVWINDGDSLDEWGSIAEDYGGGPIWASGVDIKLPATVLHNPEES